MATIKRKRRAELLHKALEILVGHPGGLSPTEVLARVERCLPLTDIERSIKPSRPTLRNFEEAIWLGTIAATKAGWFRNDPDRWWLTEEGYLAYSKYQDPEELLVRAGRQSVRGWASVQFPRFYSTTTKAVDHVKTELKLLKRLGVKEIVGSTIGVSRVWHEILPLQAPQRFVLEQANFKAASDIPAYLESIGCSYQQGGHTLYLSPASIQQTVFSTFMMNYPPGAGLKIIKNSGGIDESGYLRDGFGADRGQSAFQNKVTHGHRHLSLVANLLFSENVGPRLYDLVELKCQEQLWTAYVLQHVDEREPSTSECEIGIDKLRKLDAEGYIRINIPQGFEDEDFTCPSCNKNAFIDDGGVFRYIDFQHFTLVNYESFLKKRALEAAKQSHFGDTYLLRGRKQYLYQSIPGVSLPGKRSVEKRMVVLGEMMTAAGLDLRERSVLDVGCNIGMMMAQYLKLGARWCHGWDRAHVTPHTERLLLALGCTRFSLTGCDIDESRNLKRDLPEFLQGLLQGCVISYLAVRGHVGWLPSLASLPWSFLIYEGHEEETLASFEEHLGQLKSLVSFKVCDVRSYRDGDSADRLVAILSREQD